MPQYRAIRSFGIPGKGKYGHIRTGLVVTMPEMDANTFNRQHPKDNPILVPYEGHSLDTEPKHNASIPGAPSTKDDGEVDDPHADRDDGRDLDEGNENPSARDDKPSVSVKGGLRGAGRGKRSSALPVGRASRKRT